MKKILALIPALLFGVVACSDDDSSTTLPELPDNDMNINIPAIPADWAPGMDYKPYDTIMPEPGVKVNVLVLGESEKNTSQIDVVNNDAWIWQFGIYASSDNVVKEENKKLCFFPNHDDIVINCTNDTEAFNPNGIAADVVLATLPVYRLNEAIRNMEKLENEFEKYPLIVASGGDYNRSFSETVWDLCIRIGGLDWEEDIVPYFGWEDYEEWVGAWGKDTLQYYYPGNVGAAYAVQNVNAHNHVDDWIIVGRSDGSGNMPGPILKDRWICAPYSFNVKDVQTQSSDCGAAYVAKIIAEIKRRVPEWTNKEITELIFSTAQNKGDAEIYGHGVIDPAAIWETLKQKNL